VFSYSAAAAVVLGWIKIFKTLAFLFLFLIIFAREKSETAIVGPVRMSSAYGRH
jgi:hypothetical protein